DLGYGVERKRDDFEIVGVPKSAIKGFSRRTQEIEKVAAERGITDPKRKAELGAETREKKAKELSWNQLRREWDKRLSEEERDALTRAFQRDMPYAQPVQGEGAAVDYALGHAFTREAVVPERKLEMLAMQRGLGSVTVEDVKRELAGRDLIRGEHDGKRVATTREMARDEARLIKFAVSGRGRYRPLGNPDRPLTRQWLNDDQKRAVRHVLGSRDAVTIIRGAAGTGKTTAEQELGEAFAEAGLPVVAIAQGAEASRGVLRNEAKFEKADTVARFLVDKQMQGSARQGVILVDEAGQLGTKDMLRVFDVAKELDARVVLVGDRRQHRSVAAGEPLRLLEERAGLPVAEVTEILRQSGDYRNASRALSEGRVADGFALLDQLGWIREAPEGDRYRTLADAYLAATAEKTRDGKPKTALVISPTHAEAARTTASIRLQLKADKKLGEERTVETWAPTHLTDPQKADSTNYETGDLLVFHQNAPDHKKGSRLVLAEGDKVPVEYADRFEVYRPMELRLAPGDRIRTTANGWTKDGKHRLNNGRLDTVKRFTPGGNPVLENGWVLGKDCHITHGYVVTSHASQGKTVHKVFVSESLQSLPAANRRQFYVSISRGKEQVVVFTDDKQALLKAVERTDEPLSATELAEARKVRLRQRLHKHLAFVRRLATFARTHEQHSEHRKTPSWEREKDYVR
ncbi:MAG TPA: AAA family ATPase, partial [Polyangiaceae bacterium]|nr:AAA family ATPase [Polyangiaceae bacterium]